MADNTFILDASTTGHHREYLRYLAEACGRQADGKATFRFFVDQELAGIGSGKVETVPLPANLTDPARQLSFVTKRMGEAGGGHLFLPRLNTYLVPLLEGRFHGGKPPSHGISGIWFGPQSAAWAYGGTLGARLRGLLEILRIRRLKRSAGLRRLYILNDPHTASLLSQCANLPGGVAALADPAESWRAGPGEAKALRERQSIEPEAIVFSMLGALRDGKGIEEAMNAFSLWRPKASRTAYLVIAGECLPGYAEAFKNTLAKWKPIDPGVRLVTDRRYLSDKEFAAYLQISDFLLLPYRNTYNSSGLLGHAAASGTPVLASRGGLLGQLVRENKLGKTFDPKRTASFHDVLDLSLRGKVGMETIAAATYLENNSIKTFQKTILSGLQSK